MACYDSSATYAFRIAGFWIIENIAFQHCKRHHFSIYTPVGYKKHNHLVREVPRVLLWLFLGGVEQIKLRAQFNGLFLLRHLPLIYQLKKRPLFYKVKESIIQFWRPKFIYTLLWKSTSVMPELTTQSMESSKSLAKQDQEHVAYIRFTSFCI